MNSLFEIGQKIVCVDSSDTFHDAALVEGKVYTVDGFDSCKCGAVNVTIGKIVKDQGIQICTNCGKDVMVYSHTKFSYRQTRFVPLDFDRAADEEIREAMNQTLKISL